MYFIVYSSYSNFMYEFMFLMYLVYWIFGFFITFITYLEFHCFIYVGVNTSTLNYEDIACRSWEYIHTWIDFLNILMKQIESQEQYYMYNFIHTDVCFEIWKRWNEYKTEHYTRSAQSTDRQTDRESNIYTRHRLMTRKTGKQRRIVREGDRDYYW